MKRYILVILLVILSVNGYSAEHYNINHGWKFFHATAPADDRATVVNLPHTWNSDALGADRGYLREAGNYLRQVEIPAAWTGKRVFIRFHGANTLTELIVNGRHVGQHRGGYTAFTFEITRFIKCGESNTLWILVNNSPQPDILPTAGDANSYGGLIRDVELIVTSPVAISPVDYSSDGIYISSRKNASGGFVMETTVKLISTAEKTVQVGVTLLDAEGRQIARGEERVKTTPKSPSAVTIPITVDTPRLWNGVKDPYLYNVCVKVWDDGIVCDSAVVETGFRDFGYDPAKGFILNGEPYRLHGATVTQDRAMVGSALKSYQVEEDVALIREMGVNIVNVMGVPHNPLFYTLCDRAGIMVWSEVPFMGSASLTDRPYFPTPEFKKNGRDQLIEIIRQQFNHPSIVMWGLFNCLSQRGDNPLDYIKELNALAKKEDPYRYTACTSNQDGDLNFVTDLILWRHRYGWGEGMPSDIAVWLPYLHKTWGKLNSAVSYGAGASIDHQCDSLWRPVPTGDWHPERWQTHLHEEYFKAVNPDSLLWGVFVNNIFDYGAAGNRGGDPVGVNDMGLVTFDRKYRKDAFYFYKANWNIAEPFVYIAERRWDHRSKPRQQIRVYSNCQSVELVVNGISHGLTMGHNGTFVWPEIVLQPGRNILEAHSGELVDRTTVTLTTAGIFNK